MATKTSSTPLTANKKGVPPTVNMNSIHFIGGHKGGVGKSLVSRILLEFFIRKGWTDLFKLIEADPSIDDVARVFEDKCERIIFSDDKYQQGQPELIFDEAEKKTVVVNLPSNIAPQFDSWMATNRVLEPSEKGSFGLMYFFFVSDGCFQSINHFIKHIEKYQGKNLTNVLVLNSGRLTCSGTFHYLQEEKPLMELLKKHQVPVLLCPELPTNLQYWCDKNNLTYEAALKKQSRTLAKMRLKTFLKEIDQFWGQLFGDDINQLSGLAALIKTQKSQLDKDQLPIPTKEELIGSVS